MSKTTRVAALYLAAVFMAGALFGVVANRLYERTARASGPRDSRARYLQDLQTALVLTPEQMTQVTPILDQTGQRFRELRGRMEPEFEALRKGQRERINALLTPEQRPLYEQFQENQRRQREKHHGPR